MSKYYKIEPSDKNSETISLDSVETQAMQSLKRTDANLSRAKQLCAENKEIGITILSNLGEQRDTLSRIKNKSTDIDSKISRGSGVINKIICTSKKQKYVSIFIILLLIAIIIMLLILKFYK